MIRTLLTASALVALSLGTAAAQGETTATQPAIVTQNNDDASQRLPLAGKANPADLLKNTSGQHGSANSTQDLDKTVPAITENNNDDVNTRVAN